MDTFLISQFQKHGGIFRLPFFPATVVVVANAQDARTISTNRSNLKPDMVYAPVIHLASGPSVGSLAGRLGDSWHHRRQALNLAFAPKLVKQMNQVALNTANRWLAQTILPPLDAGSFSVSFDVGKEMVRLSFRVICRAALDYHVPDAECEDLLGAIAATAEEFLVKSMINPLRKLATPFLAKRQEGFKGAELLRAFATKVIRLYREDPSPTPDTVIDHIMKNPNYKDDSERVPDVIMILFAGHDTTGYTMALALQELAKHPNEQELLREHLKTEDGKRGYLNAVLNETMRLHPAGSLTTIRQLGNDYTSAHKGNYFVPKGSIVIVAQVAVTRDPTLFPEPHRFRPSRWLHPQDTEAAKRALFPFSVGHRNCVGQSLAMAELRSILPLLISQFRFTVEEEGKITTKGTIRLDNCVLKASRV